MIFSQLLMVIARITHKATGTLNLLHLGSIFHNKLHNTQITPTQRWGSRMWQPYPQCYVTDSRISPSLQKFLHPKLLHNKELITARPEWKRGGGGERLHPAFKEVRRWLSHMTEKLGQKEPRLWALKAPITRIAAEWKFGQAFLQRQRITEDSQCFGTKDCMASGKAFVASFWNLPPTRLLLCMLQFLSAWLSTLFMLKNAF